MTETDTLLAIGVGGIMIVYPEPATTAAGIGIVASQFLSSDLAQSLAGQG